MNFRPFLIGCLVLFSCAEIEADPDAALPFTVRDLVTWTHVTSFSSGPPLSNPVAGTALFSPDGALFLVHLRQGDLQLNANIESLLLFVVADIEKYLASQASKDPPKPLVLARLPITSDSGGITNVQWIDAHEVGFVAQAHNGLNQVYLANTKTLEVSQLTNASIPSCCLT